MIILAPPLVQSKSGVATHYPNYQALKQELKDERNKTLKLQRELDEIKANPEMINVSIVQQVMFAFILYFD